MFSVEIGRHGDGHLLSSHIASYAGDGGKSLTESVVQVQVLPEQVFASMLELVDKGDLKSPGIKHPYEFESRSTHQSPYSVMDSTRSF